MLKKEGKKKKTQTNSNNNKQQRLIDFGWRKSGLWFVLVALISHCRRHLQEHRTEEEDGKAKHVSEWLQSLPGGWRYLHHQTWARFMLLHVALRPRSLVVRGIWGRVHYLCRPDHYCQCNRQWEPDFIFMVSYMEKKNQDVVFKLTWSFVFVTRVNTIADTTRPIFITRAYIYGSYLTFYPHAKSFTLWLSPGYHLSVIKV